MKGISLGLKLKETRQRLRERLHRVSSAPTASSMDVSVQLSPEGAERVDAGDSGGKTRLAVWRESTSKSFPTTRNSYASSAVSLSPTLSTRPGCLWTTALSRLRSKSPSYLPLPLPSDSNIRLVDLLLSETASAKAGRDAERFSYTDHRGETVFYAEAFLVQLKKYAVIGDVAIQHNPDVVALVWAGFRMLLMVGTAYTENMSLISTSLSYLISVISSSEIYEQLYLSLPLASVEPLTECLVNLYTGILEYLLCAREFLQKSTMVRIVKSFSSKLAQIMDEIQRCERETREMADLAESEAASTARSAQSHRTTELRTHLIGIHEHMKGIEQTVLDCHKQISSVWEYVEGKKRLETLEWVSGVQYESHHAQCREVRVEGTGVWLERNGRFREWWVGEGGEAGLGRVLWLRGDAGSGKTMLASKIIDLLTPSSTPSHALTYFYCHYQEPTRNHPPSILRSLLKQLCVSYSPTHLPACLLAVHTARQSTAHSAGPLTLTESKSLIIELSHLFASTTMVLDALDEVDQDTRRGLLSALVEIVEQGKMVKVLVTSRNEGDIYDFLGEYPQYYIGETDSRADIGLVVREELGRFCEERRRLRKEMEEAWDGIVEELERGANGMFMWVHLRLAALRRETSMNGILNALHQFPTDLHKTYENILLRITRQSDTDHREALCVIRWVAYARGACSPDTIGEALLLYLPIPITITPESSGRARGQMIGRQRMVDICRNLVVYDETLQALRFAHYTVKEFWETRKDAQEGHGWISWVCLTVLMTDSESESGLAVYALGNWGYHLAQLQEVGPELTALWRRFLVPREVGYRRWAERIVQLPDHDALKGCGQGELIPPLWVCAYFQLTRVFAELLAAGDSPACTNYAARTPLHHAAEYGYVAIVELLLETQEVDINVRDSRGFTPLILAALANHPVVVRLLLTSQEIDANSTNSRGNDALSYAASNGGVEVISLLLAREETLLNQQDDDGDTALLGAAAEGHVDAVQLLLDTAGVDVNARNHSGRSALLEAAREGKPAVVELLLSHHAVDASCRDHNDYTALTHASAAGHAEVVRLLLSSPAAVTPHGLQLQDSLLLAIRNNNPNVVSLLIGASGDGAAVDLNAQLPWSNGMSLLSFSVWKGYTTIATLLLAQPGVDLNQQDRDGDTPLGLAVWRRHVDLVQLLLGKQQSGLDVNRRNHAGNTPLMIAVRHGSDEMVTMLLACSGLDPNVPDQLGRTPLRAAVDTAEVGTVALLLRDERVVVNAPNQHGTTPLLAAAEFAQVDIFEMVLGRYEDGPIEEVDADGDGVLLLAAVGGSMRIVEMVLERQGQGGVDVRNGEGNTPLIEAVAGGSMEVVRLLLESGVDINVRNGMGETARDVAVRLGAGTGIVDLLADERW